MRPTLEVADIVRAHGDEFRQVHAASLSAAQKRVLRAIEPAAQPHWEAISNSVINAATNATPTIRAWIAIARSVSPWRGPKWLEKRRRRSSCQCEYFHVVFTLPEPILPLSLQNKRQMYGLLFRATAETSQSIAADPKHLGAQIGFFCILHTWGQTLTAHPHLHCVVPGGGISLDGSRWVACRPGFFLPVHVLSRRFRKLYLRYLHQAYAAGKLQFHGELEQLSEPHDFARYLAPLRRNGMGCLRQAAVRRSGTGFGLPGPLYSSDRHFQQSVDRAEGRKGDFRLQGL